MTKENQNLKEKMDRLRQVKDVVYCSQLLKDEENSPINDIIQLVKENPNDYSLGSAVREYFNDLDL
jgi:hypothetical protein